MHIGLCIGADWKALVQTRNAQVSSDTPNSHALQYSQRPITAGFFWEMQRYLRNYG